MRITAHLGVLDEVELIASAVDHLYRIGVDHVIVFDMGSKDGTLEILQQYPGSDLQLVKLSNDTSWEDWKNLATESIKQAPTDWVLFLDADEFWFPATGSIKDCIALAGHDVVTVDRFNIPMTGSGLAMAQTLGPEGYGETFLYTQPIEDLRNHMIAHPDTPLISAVPAPKVIARIECMQEVTMGGHDILTADGKPVRRTKAADMVIAHVAVSTLERFERRAANITEFFEHDVHSLTGTQGWRWRRIYDLARQGGIIEEYERQIADQARMDEMIACGSVRTVAQVLAGGLSSSGPDLPDRDALKPVGV